MRDIPTIKAEFDEYVDTVTTGNGDIIHQLLVGVAISVGGSSISILLSVFNIAIPSIIVFTVFYLILFCFLYCTFSDNRIGILSYFIDIPLCIWLLITVYYMLFVIGFGINISIMTVLCSLLSTIGAIIAFCVAHSILHSIAGNNPQPLRIVILLPFVISMVTVLFWITQKVSYRLNNFLGIDGLSCIERYGIYFTKIWLMIGFMK